MCKVTVAEWATPEPTTFKVYCFKCVRLLGTFSQHESAMAWAQAHAYGSKHIREG